MFWVPRLTLSLKASYIDRTAPIILASAKCSQSKLMVLLSALCFLICPNSAYAATLSATPSTFASVWAGAAGGDVIVLAAGSYGTFSGGSKASPVTIQPASGATASMSLNFNSANNVRIDGLTLTGASLSTSRNITIANCKFTGQMVLRSDVANANILIDHSTFDGISVTPNDYEGRLQIIGSAAPAGIIVSNCHFSGGESDGIQIGADGVQIGPGNEFANILQGNSTLHIDPLQLYGARNTVITGNYFHDNSTSIMAPDGGTNEQIINNVFAGTNYPSITAGSWNGALISHNVIWDAVRVYSGNSNTPSKNVIVRDNVALNLAISAGQASVEDYNLVPSGGAGAHDVTGTPQYVGGTKPTTYAGFKLAAGSPGIGKASDGTDIGITLTSVPPVVQTTGGINWLDPLPYAKPAFVPIAVPDESTVANKYYVDLANGSGTACTQASPCGISGIAGKPGMSGGPAYVYLRGTGSMYLFNPSGAMFGSADNEIVFKPWPGQPTPVIMGGNVNNLTGPNIHHWIFDGGPNMGIKFQGVNRPNNDDVALRVNADHITLYRVQGTCGTSTATGLFYTTEDQNDLKIINSEMYDCNSGGNLQQSAVYLGGCACSASCGVNNFLFQNNIVRNMGGEGIEVNPRSPSSNVTITGSAFHHIGFSTCGASWACRPAVTMDGGSCNNGSTSNGVVSNNLMWDIAASCVWFRSAGPLYGYNNTCFDYGKGSGQISANEGMTTWQSGGGPSTTLRNNILFAPNGTVPFDNSSFIRSNNICNGSGCTTTYSSAVFVSTNQANANLFQLSGNSPAVNSGYNTALLVDYLGTPRPQGTAYDIGAFEFIGGTSSASACDLNNDSSNNVSDVQLCVNQAIGTAACSTGDINKDGACNVVDVQRTVNAALGGQCVSN
jgi:hypothetical protein